MIASHVHDALKQVKQLQALVLEKKNFTGYSGKARIISGATAFLGASILSTQFIPATPTAHLIGWGLVLIVALIANYGSLLFWFMFSAEVRREMLKLAPAIDAVPPLAIGGLFSLAFILNGHYEYLFGTWMALYGLTHIPYRNNLPKSNYIVGLIYIAAGAICMFKVFPFTNPWPMGLVFLVGEMAGGYILCLNNKKELT